MLKTLVAGGHYNPKAKKVDRTSQSTHPHPHPSSDLSLSFFSFLFSISRSVNNLIKTPGKFQVVEPPIGFHNILYPKIKPHLLSWATGAGSFVIVGLLEAHGFAHNSDLAGELKKNMAQLKSASDGGNKGSAVIIQALLK